MHPKLLGALADQIIRERARDRGSAASHPMSIRRAQHRWSVSARPRQLVSRALSRVTVRAPDCWSFSRRVQG